MEQPSLVAQLYRRNHDRLNGETIDQRNLVFNLYNFLPFVLRLRDIGSIGTFNIRRELDAVSPRPAQTHRIIILQSLGPITELTGNDFMFALVECMRCHYVLWKNGIHHQDLNPGTLMAQRELGWNYGIINDWDRAHLNDRIECEKCVTSPAPFMALFLSARLLYLEQVNGLYYHSLESFCWIMVWTFLTVKDKKVQPVSMETNWATSTFDRSIEARSGILFLHKLYEPHPEWKPYWKMAIAVLKWWFESRISGHDSEETPEKNLQLLRDLLEVIGANFEGEMPIIPMANDLDI